MPCSRHARGDHRRGLGRRPCPPGGGRGGPEQPAEARLAGEDRPGHRRRAAARPRSCAGPASPSRASGAGRSASCARAWPGSCATRPGSPASRRLSQAVVERVVELTLRRPAGRGDALDRPDDGQGGRDLAALGAADLGAHRLQPHRVRTFKLSKDPRVRRQAARHRRALHRTRRRTRSCSRSTRRAMCGWPPARKGDVERLVQRVACGHVSGLVRGRQGPQAPMGSADRDLNKSSGSRPSTSPGFPRSVGATDHAIALLPSQASAWRPRPRSRPRPGRWSAAP